MGIPQIGVDDAGNTLPRSLKDQEVFNACLSTMGMLYSTFPVLVLDDVPDGVQPYSSSGWCFSELSIAKLGGQLQRYSESIEGYAGYSRKSSSAVNDSPRVSGSSEFSISGTQSNMVCVDSECFLSSLYRSLAKKVFFDEADREVVYNLVFDYFLKEKLVDAIREREIDLCKSLLKQLPPDRKRWMLSQSVDTHLNTHLHVAVGVKSVALTELLLAHGADPTCRNLEGDEAWQRYMFPRLSKAAFVCWKAGRARIQVVPSMADFTSILALAPHPITAY